MEERDVEERDVIVVGAGPGGATSAMVLAQAGFDVLMLDRSDFPRDKICGDAVPAEAFQILSKYGMREQIDAAIERGEFYPVYKMRVVAPNSRALDADFIYEDDGLISCICPRIYFDNMIYEHAVASGAAFRKAQVKEPIIENGRVVGVVARVNGKTQEIRAKVVIGADGVTSTIARKIRPSQDKHEKHHRAIALRAYIDDIDELPQQIEFFLYDDILPGYAWIFPIGDGRANIGLGMRVDKFEGADEKLEAMLDRFLTFPDIKTRLKRGGELKEIATWQLNFGSQKIQRAFDGALLVGDAGGHIDPLTGGGISNAIITGEIAAQTIEAALLTGDHSRAFLQQYDAQVDDKLWSHMMQAWYFQRTLLRFPKMIDVLVRVMESNEKLANAFFAKM